MVHGQSRARTPPPLTVVCAGFDWGHPSPLRHLEVALSREHRVIHVESLGLRRPRPGRADLGRLLWKGSRIAGLSPCDGPRARVEVLPPRAIPLPASPVARVLNGWALERSVRRLHGADPVDVFLTALPTALEFMIRVRARTSVYYRVDDWPRWPEVDGDVVADLERMLMDRVDLTFATSRVLLKGARCRRGPAVHLPQGVDGKHFGAAMRAGPTLPAMADLVPPVLGAFGRWDDRVDWPLLGAVARDWPGTLALAGEIVPRGRRLPYAPSLCWLGPVSYPDLPAMARGVDAWILPYRVGPRTDAIDPLKLREYLATGRPVVATPMPELSRWKPLLRVADSAEGLVASAFECSRDPADGREARLAALEGEGWNQRARVFLEHVLGVPSDGQSGGRGGRSPGTR